MVYCDESEFLEDSSASSRFIPLQTYGTNPYSHNFSKDIIAVGMRVSNSSQEDIDINIEFDSVDTLDLHIPGNSSVFFGVILQEPFRRLFFDARGGLIGSAVHFKSIYATSIVDTTATEATFTYEDDEVFELYLKAIQGLKNWILLEVVDHPSPQLPGLWFARANDAHCRQEGRYVFLLGIKSTSSSQFNMVVFDDPWRRDQQRLVAAGDPEELFYVENCTVEKFEMGKVNFKGLGKFIIRTATGDPPGLDTVQKLTFTPQAD
jgi:hypothetical protein